MQSQTSIVKAIQNAARSGIIDSAQAKELRTSLGITQSFFTRKSFNRVKARAAGKRASAARKHTRGRIKGQKCNKGKRV